MHNAREQLWRWRFRGNRLDGIDGFDWLQRRNWFDQRDWFERCDRREWCQWSDHDEQPVCIDERVREHELNERAEVDLCGVARRIVLARRKDLEQHLLSS
ncbi:MAG: hypothetical protein IT381_32790 [Deltaproteobacteria bacterium]|nr:hypothetical protein [Deltaproteobacteria bacterium]